MKKNLELDRTADLRSLLTLLVEDVTDEQVAAVSYKADPRCVLTDSVWNILVLTLKGKPLSFIARQYGVQVGTIDRHLSRAAHANRVLDRTGLTLRFLQVYLKPACLPMGEAAYALIQPEVAYMPESYCDILVELGKPENVGVQQEQIAGKLAVTSRTIARCEEHLRTTLEIERQAPFMLHVLCQLAAQYERTAGLPSHMRIFT